jgi:predicted HicB family RNase H-like nuclease
MTDSPHPRSTRIFVKVSEQEHEDIFNAAADAGLSASELIRRCFQFYATSLPDPAIMPTNEDSIETK